MLNEQGENTGPSGEGLVDNVVRFAHFLRSHDIPIPFSSLLDALKGLNLIDVSQIRALYDLLLCHFVCKKNDLARFDGLFWQFWLQAGEVTQAAFSKPGSETEEEPQLSPFEEKRFAQGMPEEPSEAQHTEAIRYSPHPLHKERPADLTLIEESQDLYEAILRLLAPLTHRVSRRYRYTVHGKEISLRRILRKNMQFGGELILLDFKRKKLKRRRILFFCDVSGSMDIHTLMILQFVHALKRVDPSTEIFFFSTELTRATPLFASQAFFEALSELPQVVEDWGGGTRIGHCLKAFNEMYGSKWLSSNAILMIFSDGWDRGEIALLEGQMAYLKRKAYKVIWLNPLLGTRDYQPICQGMSAALPLVDYLLPASNLHDLQYVGNVLERMIS